MTKIAYILQVLAIALGLAGWRTLEQVDAPTFTPAGGSHEYGVAVEIHSSTEGSQIYYTTDGSAPNRDAMLYTGVPITITNHASSNHDPDPDDESKPQTALSRTIKAIAVKGGLSDSADVEASFVVDKVEYFFNIAYADPPGGDCSNKHLLDIYKPRGLTNTPVLFFVHGGAWREGDKNVYLELGNTFAGDYQMTTVIINYRLTNQACNAQHPDHMEDVARAFQWVVNTIANYGGDPGNIHIFGQSAGGHLVSLLATDPHYLTNLGLSTAQIRSVTTMSGAYNLQNFTQETDNPLGLTATEVAGYRALFIMVFGNILPQTLLGASPGFHASADQPPFFIIGLEETTDFSDMPGFMAETNAFYQQLSALHGPPVALRHLTESDIPPQVLALEFPDFLGDVDGHYEEIYAINTASWDSVSGQAVADYIKSRLPLRLTWPDGGERIITQAQYTITWESSVAISAVKLEYSSDDGENWSIITESAPNTGSYVWTAPSATAWLARVRISAASGRPVDVSTGVFAVSPPLQIYLPTISMN